MLFRLLEAKAIVRYGSLLLIAISAAMLCGWLFGWKELLQVRAGTPCITCDTAAMFTLAGLGLHALHREASRFSRILGVAIALLGAVYLITANFRFWFSVHRFFPSLTAAVVAPLPVEDVRMAVASAIVFLAIGILLVLMSAPDPGRHSLNIAAVLATGITAIGLLGILALFIGIETQNSWSGFLLRMSTSTALCACIVGISSCALVWIKSRSRQEQLPRTAAVLALLGLLLLFAGLDSVIVASVNAALGNHRSLVAQQIGVARLLNLMQRTVLVSYLVAVAMIGLALYVVGLEIRRRGRVESELRESGRELESKVAERTLELTRQSELLQVEIAQRRLTEQSLKQADQRLQIALSFANVAVWTFHVDTDTLLWSGPVESVFGVNSADLASYTALDELVHPEQRDFVRNSLSEAAEGGADYSAEFQIIRPDGQLRWIATLGGAVFDEHGKVACLSGINFDISDRKFAEQELRLREQQLAMVFEHGGLGNWNWDIAKDELTAHPTVWALYGSPGETGSRSSSWFQERQHPDDHQMIDAQLRDALEGHGKIDLEFRVIWPDSSVHWIACRGVVVRDVEGKPTHTHGLNIDITERKLAELRIQESERQFRQQADAMPQIVWTAARDGGVDYYNQRWYEYTGLSFEQTKQWAWSLVIHPDDLATCVEINKNGIASGTPFEIECRIRRGFDNSYRWHLARSVPYCDEQGTILRWFGTSTDIHEQKTAKEYLESEVRNRTAELRSSLELLQITEEELRRSLTEKETLLKEVHHRVKNNLQVISSLLRMQATSLEDGRAAAALKESEQRVLSMALIHERLYGSHQMDEIDFGEYAATLVNELFYSYAGGTEAVFSRVDASCVLLKIDQAIPCGLILNELVTNALKYAYPDERSGEVFIQVKETPSGRVRLSVSDRGVGLPENFDLKSSKSMGLAIVEILAKQIRGNLMVVSREGASFTVDFPKNLDDSEATPRPANAEREGLRYG